MTRDAEMAGRDFVELVLRGIAAESDSSVVRVLLRQVESALALYIAPDHRDVARRRFADRIAELMRTAEPGSDSQLQFVRSFTSTATTDEHLALVQALLDGSQTLEGLQVDTDLRWDLLHQLVARGAPVRPRSTPSWPATTRPPAGGTPLPPARLALTPPPSARPGPTWSRTTSCPTRSRPP
jgi:aminopeptidase N